MQPAPVSTNDNLGDNKSWWKPFYDDAAMQVLASKPMQQIRGEIDLISRLCSSAPPASVLDQCCGLGQHAIEFSKRGYLVAGIDQSALYIDQATQAASERLTNAHPPSFHRADALTYRHSMMVDIVYNWHSSFGYLPTEEGNLRMIRAAFESLVAGGFFLLEYPNVFHLLANFQQKMVSDNFETFRLVRTSVIDPCQSTLRQTWKYEFQDGAHRAHKSEMQLYLPPTLKRMLQQIGFTNIQCYGGSGAPLTMDSARCIVLGRKP